MSPQFPIEFTKWIKCQIAQLRCPSKDLPSVMAFVILPIKWIMAISFIKGQIIYFFDGRAPELKHVFFISLASASIMEHFLEGIASLRQWYIKPNEKIIINTFKEMFQYVRHQLNTKPPFKYWQSSAFKDVNDFLY